MDKGTIRSVIDLLNSRLAELSVLRDREEAATANVLGRSAGVVRGVSPSYQPRINELLDFRKVLESLIPTEPGNVQDPRQVVMFEGDDAVTKKIGKV
jgi:hypothetical protein